MASSVFVCVYVCVCMCVCVCIRVHVCVLHLYVRMYACKRVHNHFTSNTTMYVV